MFALKLCLHVVTCAHLHLMHLCIWTSVCTSVSACAFSLSVCVCTPCRLLFICGLVVPVDSKGAHAEKTHQSSDGGCKKKKKIDRLGRIQMRLLTLDAFARCLWEIRRGERVKIKVEEKKICLPSFLPCPHSRPPARHSLKTRHSLHPATF